MLQNRLRDIGENILIKGGEGVFMQAVTTRESKLKILASKRPAGARFHDFALAAVYEDGDCRLAVLGFVGDL